MTHDPYEDDHTPWRDKERLHRLYVEERKTTTEIADELDTHETTISRWLRRHGIGVRDISERSKLREGQKPAPYRTDNTGYEKWHVRFDDEYHSLAVHRLVAIAEYGTDAVAGDHVHHKNGIQWDNRPENLEILSPSDHISRHRDGEASYYKINKKDCREIQERVANGEFQTEVAEDYGVSQSTIGRHVRDECLHE